jgi:hypothetical protein
MVKFEDKNSDDKLRYNISSYFFARKVSIKNKLGIVFMANIYLIMEI